jgi:uroporphyrinogen-III synthase
LNSITLRKVVITRSREGNADLAPKLEAMGLEVVPMDLLSFLPPESWAEVDQRLAHLSSFDWLAFTSTNGVRFFLQRMKELGLPLSGWATPKVAAVGEGTAESLTEAGTRVDFTPERYLTSALADKLPGPPGRVLLLRADRAEKSMVSTLQKRGFSVDDTMIYRTRLLELNDFGRLEGADMVVFGSPSAVEALCTRLSSSQLAQVTSRTAACIGPVTAAAARRFGFARILMPDSNTFDSLVQAIGREIHNA